MMWQHKKLFEADAANVAEAEALGGKPEQNPVAGSQVDPKVDAFPKDGHDPKARLMVRMVVILKLQLMVKTVMILKLRLMVKMAMMANLKSLMMFLLKLSRKELNYLDRLEIQEIHRVEMPVNTTYF